ncbi:MAG: adenine phosphoribosyltransferase [Cyclobacteriaceae bacterium]
MLENRIKSIIRDVPDFPKPGILFKDITPLLHQHELSKDIVKALSEEWREKRVHAIAGIESRGFIYGMSMAQEMGLPFLPVRKAGKLPYKTYTHAYELEYGSAEIEIHVDAVEPGMNVLIHDDLLATGGTAEAAASLIKKAGGCVSGFSFLVELSFLKGKKLLRAHSNEISALVTY